MRLFLRSLLVLTLILAAVPIVQATAPADAPDAPMDDELILLASDGRIVVNDPYTPPDIRPVVWQSPGTGFTNVVTGDFNGDTAAEIVGIRYNEAIVFSPVVLPGSQDVSRTFEATAGQQWTKAVTGDLDGDGRDELVLVQTTSEPGLAIRMFSYQWEPGGGWTQTSSDGYGAPWQAIATGDVNGDGADEFVAVRNSGSFHQIVILKLDIGSGWITLFNKDDYDYAWITIEVGDTNADGGNREEMVVTRGGVGSNLPSMLVFRYTGSSSNLDTVANAVYYPYFEDIALGDVNSSGIDTIYLLRPGLFDGNPVVALTNLYYGPGTVARFNELGNQTRFQTIHTGDLYGTSRAQLITMASTEYLIYTNPAINVNFDQIFGNFSSTTNFAVANLDGPGLPTGPALAVNPTSISFDVQAGQIATQQVQISNTGTGTLNWTASVIEGGSWLTVSPASGTAPANIAVKANATDLVGGTYTGKVRVAGVGTVVNSPVDIPVSLTVTAPEFSVRPSAVSWYYRPGTNPPSREVAVVGPSINWHAGTVPTSAIPQIEEAITNGTPMRFDNGVLMLGDQHGPDDVPIVDWIDIDPSVGTATPGGAAVQLDLVTSQVPYGFNTAAVVFVADQVASPPAVIVRVSVLRSLPDQSDLTFMPLLQQNR